MMDPVPDAVPTALELLVLPPMGWAVAAVWGALWGSFFNVCIHRIGLYQSVTRPRSRCPRCGRPIAALENIPVLSWLLLRGRCRGCALPISIRYPLVEAASSGLATLVYWRFVAAAEGDPVWLAARFLVYFAFLGTLLVIAGIDLDHKIIPDRVTYPAAPAFFVAGVLIGDHGAGELLAGAVLGYVLVAVVIELAYLVLGRDAMGYGDAKLLMVIGALLGWKSVLFSFFFAPFFGLGAVAPLVFRRERIRGAEIPYGPWLAAAAALYLFVGGELERLLFSY